MSDLVENLEDRFSRLPARIVCVYPCRFGTADLCFQQTCSLIDLWSDQCTPYGDNRILTLVGRLIKFLAPEHQVGNKRVSMVREKVKEKRFFSSSGNCQGILKISL